MTSEWTKVKISEVCDMIVDCVNKTAPQVEYKTAFKMIRTPQIKGGRIDRENCRFVEQETFEKWTRRARVLKGDVLLTREAPMGEIGYVDFDDTVFLGQRIMQYRVNATQLDSKFLLYSFLSPALQNQFRMHEGSGSVVSHIRVPDCLNFELSLPPLDLQRKIAKILGDLDDKIELNRQTNQTLEQIAQALFKSWFVDFEPTRAKIAAKEAGASPEEIERAAMCAISGKTPDQLAQLPPETQQNLKTTAALFPDALVDSELGEIPAGWEVKTMNDISTVGIGKTPPRKESQWFSTNKQDVRWVSIRDMGIAGTYMTTTTEYLTPEAVKKFNVRIIPANTLMLSFKMTIGRLAISDGEMASNEAIAHFKLNDESSISTEFVYLYLKQFDFSTYSSTSSIADAVNSNTVKNTPILLPRNSILSMFDKKVSSIFQDLKNRERETRQLVELRDALLPKLLSGEIPITESLTDLQGAA